MLLTSLYSRSWGMAVEEVWHNNSECQIGLSITLADRLPGMDGRKQCPYCVLHNEHRQVAKCFPTQKLGERKLLAQPWRKWCTSH